MLNWSTTAMDSSRGSRTGGSVQTRQRRRFFPDTKRNGADDEEAKNLHSPGPLAFSKVQAPFRFLPPSFADASSSADYTTATAIYGWMGRSLPVPRKKSRRRRWTRAGWRLLIRIPREASRLAPTLSPPHTQHNTATGDRRRDGGARERRSEQTEKPTAARGSHMFAVLDWSGGGAPRGR